MTDLTPLPPDGWQHAPVTSAGLSGPRRLAVWGIAVLFTLFVVHWSERNGRLAQDITYDDVQYFVDGVGKQQALDGRGFPGLAAELVRRPPHSAFSTLLALASFEVLGVHDWAPYAFNLFVLVAFLLFCCRSFGDLPSTAFYCLLVFCLTIPLALFCIHEFRPDFADALATVAFAWFGLAAALGKEEAASADAVRAGLLLGAALWIKPTVFAHTLAIALVVGAGIAAGAWLPGWRGRSFKRALLLALGLRCDRGGGRPSLLRGQRPAYFRVLLPEYPGRAWGRLHSFEGSTWSIFRAFVLGWHGGTDDRPLSLAAAGLLPRPDSCGRSAAANIASPCRSVACFSLRRCRWRFLCSDARTASTWASTIRFPVLAAALAALSPMIRASRRAHFIAPALAGRRADADVSHPPHSLLGARTRGRPGARLEQQDRLGHRRRQQLPAG